jgi:hypothetical protein
MGILMRARDVREALGGVSKWDLEQMVACGTLTAVYPIGRFNAKTQSKSGGQRSARPTQRKNGGHVRGEKVPYYRRAQVEELRRAMLE